MSAAVTICRYLDVPDVADFGEQIDAIFFEASNTKSFGSAIERTAFRERWLGRYLRREPEFAYLALASRDVVAGYLIGSLRDDYVELGYSDAFRALTKTFPAHLHVNLAPRFRNQGIGGRLIAAFAADAKKAGASGVHVVTGANSENVRFYNRNGFNEVARSEGARPLVFLARHL